MQTLLEQVEKFKKTQEEIRINRQNWNDGTKEVLFNTLSSIVNNYKLDWHVQKNEEMDNLNSIILVMNKSKSGLIERTNSTFTAHVKHGGCLIFSQAYNGEIYVTITFPYIPEWVEQLNNITLVKIRPSDIDEKFIFDKVEKFLAEMVKWEQNSGRETVGFKLPNES